MNLVAKEYVAAQNPNNPGVPVLSRFAGAARELDAALIVNPFDYDDVSDAIIKGLDMHREERIERWNAIMKVLKGNTLANWRDDFIRALRQQSPEDRDRYRAPPSIGIKSNEGAQAAPSPP